MRSERLNELTALLVNHRDLTADELARRLGVSVRTIYRDIGTLADSGVPVVALSGVGGGYNLAEGYRLDGSVVKSGEWGPVVAGLQSLATVVDDRHLTATLEKFRASAPARRPGFFNSLYLELTPGTREKDHLGPLRQALDQGLALDLTYRGTDGAVTDRRVDPLAVVFHWGGWYLYAWCHLRQEGRLFKVLRIDRARVTGHRVGDHRIDLSTRPWRQLWDDETAVPVALRFFAPAHRRVLEEFEPGRITSGPEGSLEVRLTLALEDGLVGWLLGYGGEVEVVAPETLRRAVRDRAQAAADRNS